MLDSSPEVVSQPDTHAALSRPSASKASRGRILYAVGPGDVAGLYRDLLGGREPAFQVAMAFSKQFLDWCDQTGAAAHLMSSHPRADCVQVGPHRVENRPRSSLYYGGSLKFHLGYSLYGLTVVAQALRHRATAVIVDSGTAHWFVFSLLSLFRIPVIAVMHNALWPLGFPPTRKSDRSFRILDGFFFRHFAAATVCISPECERQVRAVAGTLKGPVYQCLPLYRRTFMTRIPAPPDPALRPFRVLFLGRVEDYKGVFLILSIAQRLEQQMPGQFIWKIVGEGHASETLIQQARERNLDRIVEIPGSLPDEDTALETLGWAHAMIVPTTSRFPEGLAMTAAEAILAGRPVVLSSVVPAYEILGPAAIRVEPDNPDAFAEALRNLALDPDHYSQCQRATANAQAQFYESSAGLGAVLGRAISALP